MGEFQSGPWIIALSLYFFAFFLIVFSAMNVFIWVNGTTGGLSVQDPGFQTLGNHPFAQNNACSGSPYHFCKSFLYDEPSCNAFPGCSWNNNDSFSFIFFSGPGCAGSPAINCSQITNRTTCENTGCTYSTFNGIGDTSTGGLDITDLSMIRNTFTFYDKIKATVIFMATFNASFSVPGIIAFIVSFILFWLPLMALLFAIYMALPVIH